MNFHDRFKLLAVFHYVLAGITALFGCVPLIYVPVGIMFLTGSVPPTGPNEPPPELFGLMFVAIGTLGSVLIWAFAAATAACGYYLHVQRHYTFCLVVAAAESLNMPFGTILGVFTIITLVDAQGKAMFERPEPQHAKEPPA